MAKNIKNTVVASTVIASTVAAEVVETTATVEATEKRHIPLAVVRAAQANPAWVAAQKIAAETVDAAEREFATARKERNEKLTAINNARDEAARTYANLEDNANEMIEKKREELGGKLTGKRGQTELKNYEEKLSSDMRSAKADFFRLTQESVSLFRLQGQLNKEDAARVAGVKATAFAEPQRIWAEFLSSPEAEKIFAFEAAKAERFQNDQLRAHVAKLGRKAV